MPPRNIVCPTFQVSSNETLTVRTVRLILPLYICLISDSLFNVRFPTGQFHLSISDVKRPSEFSNVLQTLQQKHLLNLLLISLVKSNFDTYNQQTILLLYSACQNVISRGLPIFGSFCKLLINVVTETFAGKPRQIEF